MHSSTRTLISIRKTSTADREAVIARARGPGVEAIVAVGITAATERGGASNWRRDNSPCLAAVGIQPNYTGRRPSAGDWDRIVALAGAAARRGDRRDRPRSLLGPFAVRRAAGLFRSPPAAVAATRPAVHRAHARERCRRAGHARAAARRGPLRGVMHSFTGTAETAAECVELGLYISFAGMVTFKKSSESARRGRHDPGRPHSGRNRQPLSCRRIRSAASATSRPTWFTRRPVWPTFAAKPLDDFAPKRRPTPGTLFRLLR